MSYGVEKLQFTHVNDTYIRHDVFAQLLKTLPVPINFEKGVVNSVMSSWNMHAAQMHGFMYVAAVKNVLSVHYCHQSIFGMCRLSLYATVCIRHSSPLPILTCERGYLHIDFDSQKMWNNLAILTAGIAGLAAIDSVWWETQRILTLATINGKENCKCYGLRMPNLL